MLKFNRSAVFAAILLVAISVSARAQKPRYHVEIFEEKQFTITVTDILPFNSRVPSLVLIATVPPSLPSQKDMTLTMRYDNNKIGVSARELSPLHREILVADLKDVAPKPAITTEYKGILRRRRLAAGAPTIPVPELTPEVRSQTLAATTMCDYNKPDFQAFLNASNLHPRIGEGELMFGYRAFCFVKDKYTYEHTESSGSEVRTANFLRTVSSLDCGEAVLELAAILRSNSIPCRIKVGRNVVPDDTHEYGAQRHVKAEYFVSGIGWVPIEIAGALGLQDTTYTFGYDNYYFLVTHVENDLLLDVKEEKKRTIHWWSVMRFFGSVREEGITTEKWTIESSSTKP